MNKYRTVKTLFIIFVLGIVALAVDIIVERHILNLSVWVWYMLGVFAGMAGMLVVLIGAKLIKWNDGFNKHERN